MGCSTLCLCRQLKKLRAHASERETRGLPRRRDAVRSGARTWSARPQHVSPSIPAAAPPQIRTSPGEQTAIGTCEPGGRRWPGHLPNTGAEQSQLFFLFPPALALKSALGAKEKGRSQKKGRCGETRENCLEEQLSGSLHGPGTNSPMWTKDAKNFFFLPNCIAAFANFEILGKAPGPIPCGPMS